MSIEHINPAGMHRNPAFSQGIIVPAGARTLVIGGQNAVNEKGEVVGKGDMAAQTTKALDNLVTVLEAAGASLDNLIRPASIFGLTPISAPASAPGWRAPERSRIRRPSPASKSPASPIPTFSSKSKPRRFCHKPECQRREPDPPRGRIPSPSLVFCWSDARRRHTGRADEGRISESGNGHQKLFDRRRFQHRQNHGG